MKQILKSDKVIIPDGVTISVSKRVVTVTGPRGSLSRSFKHLQIDIQVLADEGIVKVDSWFTTKKQSACVRTVCSTIQNLITGVIKGYEYRMRLVYAHFPINTLIAADKNSIEIRNYIGERAVRKLQLLPNVTIEKSDETKDELILRGNDLNSVSLSAALIQQSCRAKRKDVRKFLDGIYVSETKTIVREA
jgi:large subunit ribosomal protein L9e